MEFSWFPPIILSNIYFCMRKYLEKLRQFELVKFTGNITEFVRPVSFVDLAGINKILV